ncbi:hypothetical protein BAE44_0024823 [Dichanthelium oligosanthes]|uniref:Drought-induced protein 1 n=1 Tax=Dichanthelium oligosanthes TaxID=888268 RepID=A0A1E5UMW7_9POAL|nr:hypothetical protein BAE44_0024823 [Dichanthelium oligosanthes]
MVATIAVASAGLGMLAGVAMANRSSSEGSTAPGQWRPGGGPMLRWGGGAPRCEACGGSGKEECRLCARWSDAGATRGSGRSGCGACAGTRRAPCRSCGGSGTGRRAPMVGPIVLAASAGLGMLAGLATADRCSSSGSSGNHLPLAGASGMGPTCATCGGTGEVACLCARWSDGDVGCRPCAGSGRTACRSCRGSGTGRRAPVRVAVCAQRPLVAVTKAK